MLGMPHPQRLGNQTQDPLRPVFLSHTARLSLGVKTFCPWMFLAQRERPQNKQLMSSQVVKAEAWAPSRG